VPNGTAVLVAPAPGNWVGFLGRIAGASITSRVASRKVHPFLSHVSPDDLRTLTTMIEGGAVMPVIDRTVRFEEIPDAIRYVESGKARGKVVVTI
jgi:NADPH:quinone reductase-like Zn-dependent oxidoreductase